jgi:hypothetical protein
MFKPFVLNEFASSEYIQTLSGLERKIAVDIVNALARDSNEVFFKALSNYIPDVSMLNISEYADRITIERVEDNAFPQRFWLDKNEKDEGTMFLVLQEPKFDWTGDTVKAIFNYESQ